LAQGLLTILVPARPSLPVSERGPLPFVDPDRGNNAHASREEAL